MKPSLTESYLKNIKAIRMNTDEAEAAIKGGESAAAVDALLEAAQEVTYLLSRITRDVEMRKSLKENL